MNLRICTQGIKTLSGTAAALVVVVLEVWLSLRSLGIELPDQECLFSSCIHVTRNGAALEMIGECGYENGLCMSVMQRSLGGRLVE